MCVCVCIYLIYTNMYIYIYIIIITECFYGENTCTPEILQYIYKAIVVGEGMWGDDYLDNSNLHTIWHLPAQSQ